MSTPKYNNNGTVGRQTQQTVAIDGIPQRVIDDFNKTHPAINVNQKPMNGSPSGVISPVATMNPNIDFFANGNRAVGKYDAQPVQTGAALPTDFTQMQKQAEFVPQGAGNANPTLGPVASPYTKDAAVTTQQPQTTFEGMQKPAEFNAPSLQEHSDVGYKGGPYDPSQYDSLSAALNGGSPSAQPQQAEFQADPNQRDGGFFNWIKGLMPKKRPGKREGETDDEYDARRTRNMEMWATFADAIRHMGNIVNTAKGAPLQQFNDPTAMLEQGYQNRKAQRQKQAALDADAAYKQANMSLKERAAEADRAYKQLTLGYKDSADRRAQRQFEYQVAKDAAADQYKRDKDKRDFEYKQDRDKAKDEQTGRRLAISEYNATHKGSGRGGRSGKGGSGSGGKYWFEDKNGKMHFQPNKTMWEQEYYREYGKLPQGETSTSTSTKVLNKDGSEKTVTTRSKGNSMTAQAAASQNAAKAARNKGKSGGSKGHGALNAWFKKNNK